MKVDYEERFLRIRDENLELKKKRNEHELTIKRMYTKLTILEEQLRKHNIHRKLAPEVTSMAGNQNDLEGKQDASKKLHSEAEKMVLILRQKNAALRKQIHSLLGRNRTLENRIKQAPCEASSRSHPYLGPKKDNRHHKIPASLSPSGSPKKLMRQKEDVSSAKIANHADNATTDPSEKRVMRLMQRGRQLQQRAASKNNSKSCEEDSDEKECDPICNDSEYIASAEEWDRKQLKRQLRNRKAQVSILKARYEDLKYKSTAERELQAKTIDELDAMNRQVYTLREELQDAQEETAKAELKALKAKEAARELVIAREQNRKMERRLTALCETPFISKAYKHKEKVDKLHDLEKQVEDQIRQIRSLTNEASNGRDTIKDLQRQLREAKEARDRLEVQLENVNRCFEEERSAHTLARTAAAIAMANAVAEEHLPANKVFRKEDKACSPRPFTEHQAQKDPPLAQHTSRRMDLSLKPYVSPFNLDFLEPMPQDDTNSSNGVKHLKNRVHVLQMAHANALKELEHSERMLQAQTNINRELAEEIKDLTSHRIASKDLVQQKLKESIVRSRKLQQTVFELKDRIQQLESANDQLEKRFARASRIPGLGEDEKEDSDAESIPESLVSAAKGMEAGGQLLEVYIQSASFNEKAWNSLESSLNLRPSENLHSVATFVLCDFYDFESQSTALVNGISPVYNIAMTFPITTDAFFLRYMASEKLFLEVHQAIHGDFRLVGRAYLPLSRLLTSPKSVKHPNLPIYNARVSQENLRPSSDILGTMQLTVRTSGNLSEIWNLHVEASPLDKQLLPEQPQQSISNTNGNEPRHTETCELEISVLRCRELKSDATLHSANHPPSAYVHYKVHGFPDTFTNVVPTCCNPRFDPYLCANQPYAMRLDAQLLDFIEKTKLYFTVFDDSCQEQGTEMDGMIGKAGVPLRKVARGNGIRNWVPLFDRYERPAGFILIRIDWVDAISVAKLHSLASSVEEWGQYSPSTSIHCRSDVLHMKEMYSLMTMFSPESDGRVHYPQFIRFGLPISEMFERVCAKIKVNIEEAIDAQCILNLKDWLTLSNSSSLGGSSMYSDKLQLRFVSWNHIRMRLESIGVSLNTEEFTALKGGFYPTTAAELRNPTEDNVCLSYLLLALDPRKEIDLRVLEHKVRETLLAYIASNGISPMQHFENLDKAGTYYVSNCEFKQSLIVLGFVLLNADQEWKETGSLPAPKSVEPLAPGETERSNEMDDDQEQIASPKKAASKPNVTAKTSQLKKIPDCIEEFERRKEAFHKRMQDISSKSYKSFVHEHLQKQHPAPEPFRLDKTTLQTCTEKLHKPSRVHHDAATTVQKVVRGIQTRSFAKNENYPSHIEHDIVSIDREQSEIVRHQTAEKVSNLKKQLLHEASGFPSAKNSVSRQQMSHVLSKLCPITLPPAHLGPLLDHFTIHPSSEIAYQDLIHFLCSTQRQALPGSSKQSHALLDTLQSLENTCVNVPQCIYTFTVTCDYSRKGIATVKNFQDTLHRIKLTGEGTSSSINFFALLLLLDLGDGIHFLYEPLLRFVSQSKGTKKLLDTLQRLDSFSLSRLREAIYMAHPSEKDMITHEELHRILMQQCNQSSLTDFSFHPEDSKLLFSLLAPYPKQADHSISIASLLAAISQALSLSKASAEIDNRMTYSLTQLQALCRNIASIFRLAKLEFSKEFARFDWSKLGTLPLKTFVYVLRERIAFGHDRANAIFPFSSLFSLKQIELQVAKHFLIRKNETFEVQYLQFLDWMEPHEKVIGLSPNDVLHDNADELDGIQNCLHAHLQLRRHSDGQNTVSKEISTWRNHFQFADRMNTKTLSRLDFAKTCEDKIPLPVSKEDLRLLLYAYDRFGLDEIPYELFLQLQWRDTIGASPQYKVLPPEPDRARDLMRDLVDHLRRASLVQLTQAWQRYSTGNFWSQKTFIQFQQALKAPLSAKELQCVYQEIAKRPRTNDESGIDMKQFLWEDVGFSPFAYDPLHMKSIQLLQRKAILQHAQEKMLAYLQRNRERFSVFERFVAMFSVFCAQHRFKPVHASQLCLPAEDAFRDMLSAEDLARLTRSCAVSVEQEPLDDDLVSLHKLHQFFQKLEQRASVLLNASQPITRDAKADRKALVSDENDSKLLHSVLLSVARLMKALEIDGMDLRSRFEARDEGYSGGISAMKFKSVMEKADLITFLQPDTYTGHQSAFDRAMGILVRHYRVLEPSIDSIQYTIMLHHASCPSKVRKEYWPLLAAVERFRSSLRLQAGFQGSLRCQNYSALYTQLDSVFRGLDESNKSFLTSADIHKAMKPLFSASESVQFHGFVFKQIAIFQHINLGGNISRMEFDAFVLDPQCHKFLKRISDQLTHEQSAGIGRLTQLCAALDPNSTNLLPLPLFLSNLSQSLPFHATLFPLDRHRIQHLFDIHRTQQIAYRLFYKVIFSRNPSLPVHSLPQTPASAPDSDPIEYALVSIHHQLSSIDFQSQSDILRSYFVHHDPNQTNFIPIQLFSDIITDLGIHIPEIDMQQILNRFLANDPTLHTNSEINYARFLQAVRSHSKEPL